MSIKERVQEEMKAAMKSKDAARLECLRMMKGALLHKEKASSEDLTDADTIAVLRSEVRKRQESVKIFREVGKEDEAVAAEGEVAVIEEFLPQQITAEQVQERVRTYLADHPEITHAGRLTGILKKEWGDEVDGRLLNEACRKAIDG